MKPVQLNYITKEYIAQFLPTNPIILEAGAHKGKDTLALHAQWPAGTIYAFEPVPELYEILKTSTSHIPSIYSYHCALGDSIGTTILYKCSGKIDAASSLFKPGDYFLNKPVQFDPITVNIRTVDDWAAHESVHTINFMWLDLQGGELALLQNAQSILNTVNVIHTEVNLVQRYHSIPNYEEIKTFLSSFGFQVQAEAFYKKTWGNVLFVKE
ncbi:MAG: 2-O-methyltransferase NoeI [Candidatus Dependentiae bacterium ADurb.Bin331]|nr:MAG: 2-O-methyltransferase NoeI [Candidatus Dependentiae bacterium ADurb.Bin331]